MSRQLLTLFFVLEGFVLATIPAEGAPNCPVGGTTIVYGNGVNTTALGAHTSMWRLRDKVRAELTHHPAIDPPSCINFAVAYDPAPFTSQIANIAAQVFFIASVQAALQFAPQFPAWLDSPASAPSWFAQTLNLIITTSTDVQSGVLNGHLALYTNELSNGNKVIAVTHSQGNFYVNQAYPMLRGPIDDTKFSVIGVATPANHVAGSGPYLTLFNDIITSVPFSLPANIVNNPPTPGGACSFNSTPTARFTCHCFDTSYLPGATTGPAIVNYVINAIPVPLVVHKSGAGTGTVQSTPPGIDCGSKCTAAFPLLTNGSLTSVTLTATADQGATFTAWSGMCTLVGTATNNTITFPILNVTPDNCTAEFGGGGGGSLTVTKSGTGTGTVSSVPAGINCGPACTTQNAPFPATPPVQLTATRAAGSIFTGWSGDCASAGTNPTAQVTVDANKTCNAKFDLGGILTVTKSGTGTVTSVPAGINCGPTCTTQNAPFLASPPVQLTAAPASAFTGWGGDCATAGMNPTAQVTLTSDKSCTAAFGSAPAVRLNPFGNQSVAPPYNIEVVNSQLALTPAPGDITVTLLRDVISQCSGLLFSSNRTVVVSQGQSSAAYNFNAGRDPACNALPITTRYTVTQAVLKTVTVLDLSGVPAQQLVLTVTR